MKTVGDGVAGGRVGNGVAVGSGVGVAVGHGVGVLVGSGVGVAVAVSTTATAINVVAGGKVGKGSAAPPHCHRPSSPALSSSSKPTSASVPFTPLLSPPPATNPKVRPPETFDARGSGGGSSNARW